MALFAARVMGLGFVVLSVTMLVAVWGSYERDTRIVAEDLHASGTVLKKEVLEDPEGNDYVLHYAFTPPDGTRWERQGNVSPDLWRRLRVGDSVDVLYSREDPRRGYPEGHGVTGLGLALYCSVVLVMLLAMGAVFLLARAVPPEEKAVDA